MTDEERREKERARWRLRVAKDPEKLRERVRAYRQKNREKLLAQSRAWRAANREKQRAYYQKNREKLLAAAAARRKANLQEHREERRLYERARRRRLGNSTPFRRTAPRTVREAQRAISGWDLSWVLEAQKAHWMSDAWDAHDAWLFSLEAES